MLYIEYFEMKITTISKTYLLFEVYLEQPKQMVKLRMNMILNENAHLMNSLDRSVNHPST